MITISHRRQGGSKRKCKRPVDTRYDNTDRYIAQHGREVSRAFHKYVQETYGILEVDTWLGRAIATGRAAPWEDVINAAAGGGQDELRYRDRFGAEAHGQLIDAIGRSIRGADFCPWIELALAIGEPHPWEGGSPLGVPEDPRDLLEEVAANPGDPVAAIAAYRAARRVRQLEAWRRPPLQPPQPEPAQPPPAQPQPAQPQSAPAPAIDEVTFALNPAGGRLAKLVLRDQGLVVAPRFLRQYRYAVELVSGLRELFRVLQRGDAAGAFVVRAKPKVAVGRRAIHDDPVKGPAGLEEVSRHHAALDFDGVVVAGVDPLDGAACARAIRPLLPPELQRVSLIWQLTASAGVKSGIRLRTWHWFDRPLSTAWLKSWLVPYSGQGGVELDLSTLEAVQPVFLAVTGGPEVPRWGLLEGPDGDTAIVPVIAPRATRARVGAPARGRAQAHAGGRARTGGRASPARMRQLIRECIGQIRAARGHEGQRLPAYKHWGGRALALAEIAGIDRGQVEALIVRAGAQMYDGDDQRIERNVEPMIDWWREQQQAEE